MSFLDQLNPAQRQAVTSVHGPMMVVAGPGSGKTRVLTYRIAYLISIGVPAYQIMALTFTNKAANEMKERIIKLVGPKSQHLWMGTFHSIFARLLRLECEKLGFHRNFSIYDTTDSLRLIENIMTSIGIPRQQFNPQAVWSCISGVKNRMIAPQEFAKQASDIFEEKTANVYFEYQMRLKQNNAMDFDDLLLYPTKLFEGHKKVLAEYQDRFRYILIDEYQDTNRAQYVLIKHLAAKDRNICVVGDDAQSIYAFRGADIRNILDFECDYPDAKVVRLEENYRSTKTILAAADKVIKNNIDQIPKNLWTNNHDGDPVTVLASDDEINEGALILSRIVDDLHKMKMDFNDFAIMYRTNAQSRSLEDVLRRNNIPYIIIGGIEFYQRREVKDILAYLRVIVNTSDDESLLRIVNYPTRGLGENAIKHLKRFAGKNSLSLFDAILRAEEIPELTARAKQSFRVLSDMFLKYLHLKEQISASELSRAIVDEVGVLKIFKEEGTPDAIVRWENVQELLSSISEFTSQQSDATLEKFMEDVSLVHGIDQWDDNGNAVTLMTLHSAKGLEFPVVFITGLEEGLLPFYNSIIDRKELEEERRLCYVGMTRAMRKLYLSYVHKRYRFGDVSYSSPSRFIDEIGKELVVMIDEHETHKYSNSRCGEKRGNSQEGFLNGKVNIKLRYSSNTLPDYENDSKSINSLQVGRFVEHEVFGKGKILNISGRGDSMKVVVDFPNEGRKNLLVKYARLKMT